MADDEKKSSPSPKWLRDDHGNQKRATRSRRHETRVAKILGGKRIAQSGAKRWSRWDKKTDQGDVRTPLFHVEHKRTDCASLSVKKEWLDQVSDGAQRAGKYPAVVITFEDPVKKRVEDWILVPLVVGVRLLGIEEDP